MEAITASSSENEAAADRMVETELEAAKALAGLAHVAANMSESYGGESVSERIKAESGAGNSSFDQPDSFPKRSINPSEDQINCGQKNSEKTCIWTVKSMMETTELGPNATYPAKNVSSKSRKSRQSLTESEKEARRIYRVLANRESARQTIRRRQVVIRGKSYIKSIKFHLSAHVRNRLTWPLLLRPGGGENSSKSKRIFVGDDNRCIKWR